MNRKFEPRMDSLNELILLMEGNLMMPPDLPDKDVAKILFLAVDPEFVVKTNQLFSEANSDDSVSRLIDKFQKALNQQSLVPVSRELKFRLLSLGTYKLNEAKEGTSTLESTFSDADDILNEEEESILEYAEIFQLMGYEVPETLLEKANDIVRYKKIPVREEKKSDGQYDFKNFFVYAENKILTEICDSLTPNEVYSMYQFLRDTKHHENEQNALAHALSTRFTKESLNDVAGLKDVAFYLLILYMIKGQLINRLYTHALDWLIKEVKKLNEERNKLDNIHLDDAITKLNRYPIASRPPGLCIIFCMLENREGATADKTRVKELFKNEFQYDVLEVDNPDPNRVKTIVSKLGAPRNKFYDSLVVFFMGHGSKTHLMVKGGQEIHRRKDLIEPFTEIEWLKKKPKIFFIQACSVQKNKQTSSQDTRRLSGLQSETDSTQLGMGAGKEWMEKYGDYTDVSITNSFADTLISYATMWYQEAARGEDGSIYIDTLIDRLREFGSNESVENVLRRVNYNVNMVALKSNRPNVWKQAPYFESSLQKDFVFPKIRQMVSSTAST